MITKGSPIGSTTRKTEIVDVANGVSCSDMADFPVEHYGGLGANLGGTPIVCGGAHVSVYADKCFRLTNSVWEEFVSMKEKRHYAAGIVHNDKLHVFGGYSGSWDCITCYAYHTSETINLDGEVSHGPNLPTALKSHAMTKINEKVSLLSGGQTNANINANVVSTKTWYYNHDTETFTSGPDLLEGRRNHGSAINVDKVTKAKIAVVTGGIGNGYLDSTEMLINGQWQTGTIQCRKQKYFDLLYIVLYLSNMRELLFH